MVAVGRGTHRRNMGRHQRSRRRKGVAEFNLGDGRPGSGAGWEFFNAASVVFALLDRGLVFFMPSA